MQIGASDDTKRLGNMSPYSNAIAVKLKMEKVKIKSATHDQDEVDLLIARRIIEALIVSENGAL